MRGAGPSGPALSRRPSQAAPGDSSFVLVDTTTAGLVRTGDIGFTQRARTSDFSTQTIYAIARNVNPAPGLMRRDGAEVRTQAGGPRAASASRG